MAVWAKYEVSYMHVTDSYELWVNTVQEYFTELAHTI
jgi:hypothetical protein